MLERFFKFIFLIFFSFSIKVLVAQNLSKDTLKLTQSELEKQFVDKNLQLLAEKCGVDAANALIIQAKLFTNPTLTIANGILNPETHKWFDVSDGELSANIQKVFLLAGKRNKNIKLATANLEKEQYNYFDLLRTLKFSLKSDFNNIFFLQQTIKVYEREIISLNRIIEAFEAGYKKGYVSFNELMRLKAMLFSLENERIGFISQMSDSQAELNVLLQLKNTYIVAKLDTTLANHFDTNTLLLKSLIDTALTNRTDVKIAESNLKYNDVNLSYQKALAIPDLTIGAGWDRRGSYTFNANLLTLQIDIPIFNRNQGNIKAAKFNVDNSKYLLDNSKLQVQQDVIKAVSKILENAVVFKKFNNKFYEDFNNLIDQIVKNYEKRNISLLEFLDFYDAYKTNAVQYNTLQSNRINAFEELNFSVGKNIINY